MADRIIRKVELDIDYKFYDSEILLEALQTTGSAVRWDNKRYISDDNKRLAVLGDTALKLVLLEKWYNSNKDRGPAYRVRTFSVSLIEILSQITTRHCAIVAFSAWLGSDIEKLFHVNEEEFGDFQCWVDMYQTGQGLGHPGSVQ